MGPVPMVPTFSRGDPRQRVAATLLPWQPTTLAQVPGSS